METKHCNKCYRDLPLSEFTTQGGAVRLYCHECERARQRAYDQKRTKSRAERSREWRTKNPDRSRELTRESQRRKRAQEKLEREALKEKLPDGFKRCRDCKQVKPLAAFRKRKEAPDGYRGQCLECMVQPKHAPGYHAAWRKNNPDKLSAGWHNRRALEANAPQSAPIPPGFLTFVKSQVCCLCTVYPAQVGHVVPLARGGSHDVDNIVPLCRFHNGAQKARLMSEWALSIGLDPAWLDKIVKHANLKVVEEFNNPS